jgi:hypothetical protein
LCFDDHGVRLSVFYNTKARDPTTCQHQSARVRGREAAASRKCYDGSMKAYLVMGALLVGCAERAAVPKNTSTNAPTPPSPIVANDAGADDPLSEKLRHCPVTVDGATTDVNDVDVGVEFVIRVPSESGRAELMRRAHHLESFTQNKGKGTGVRHGGGQGGGWMRDCPIVTKETIVQATETSEGARIRVATEGDVDALRAETRRRLTALRARQAKDNP